MGKDFAGFFLDGWYVLDNFAAFQVEWRGVLYPTVEHAYQAAHFFDTDPKIAEQIRLCRSPNQAADLANAHADREDPHWAGKKLDIMQEILRCKLEQHEYVKQTLVASGSKQLVEMNDNDAFWGWGPDHKGQNQLGKLWMKLRAELAARQ